MNEPMDSLADAGFSVKHEAQELLSLMRDAPESQAWALAVLRMVETLGWLAQLAHKRLDALAHAQEENRKLRERFDLLDVKCDSCGEFIEKGYDVRCVEDGREFAYCEGCWAP